MTMQYETSPFLSDQKCTTKRKPYNRYTADQRLEMAEYAEKHGPGSAAKRFTKVYGRIIDESSVRYITKKYRQLKSSAADEGDITSLPSSKRGRPLLLGEELDEEVVRMIENLRQAGGVVTGPVVVGLGNGVVTHHNRNLLAQNGGHIELSKTWSTSILRRMNFVKRRGTKAARKVPDDFPNIKSSFLDRIRDAVREHNIPEELIINMDETGIPVVPVSDWTMEKEGSTQVPIIGKEDKNQLTAVLTSTMSGAFPRPQLIYKGKTNQCHPTFPFPAEIDVFHSPNHWANVDTMLRWIETCLCPYLTETKAALQLPEGQKALLILDIYAVHRTELVKDKLIEKGCVLVFVPAGCTGELQPLDVCTNYSFKYSLSTSFQTWYAEEVRKQLAAGHASPSICMRYSTLKPLNARWIVTAYDYVRSRPEMIRQAWEKCGIIGAVNDRAVPLNHDLDGGRTEP